MTALDNAIEEPPTPRDEQSARLFFMLHAEAHAALTIMLLSKQLIAADDREGLLRALGAEQVGWWCPDLKELHRGSAATGDGPCSACVPVYQDQAMTTKEQHD